MESTTWKIAYSGIISSQYDSRVVIYDCKMFIRLATVVFLLSIPPTFMAFTRITNAHGPSPQPTACRSPLCSLTTATGSNQAQSKV